MLLLILKITLSSVHDNKSEPWKVSLIDTGEETMTGGRLKRVKNLFKMSLNFVLRMGMA